MSDVNNLRTLPYSKHTNATSNRRYTSYLLPFQVLYNQFSQLSNLYFLLIGVLQCVPAYRITSPLSVLFPLFMVSGITIVMEAYDDYQRYKRDEEVNGQRVWVLKRNKNVNLGSKIEGKPTTEDLGNTTTIDMSANTAGLNDTNNFMDFKDAYLQSILSSELREGDIIKINKNQRVPADVVILTADSDQVFIRTDQLDGETDWKVRVPMKTSSRMTAVELFAVGASVEAPHSNTHAFHGILFKNDFKTQSDSSKNALKLKNSNILEEKNKHLTTKNNGEFESQERVEFQDDLKLRNENRPECEPNIQNNSLIAEINTLKSDIRKSEIQVNEKEPITLINVMFSGTVLATGSVYAMAVYIGRETKTNMSVPSPTAKYGLFEKELNTYAVFLAIVSFLLSFAFTIARGTRDRFDIPLLRFVVLFSNIIPLSLRTSVELARFFHKRHIEKSNVFVRNSNLPEELGRISYVVSDKTGTLTRNQMEMKKVHIGTRVFSKDNFCDILSICKNTKVDGKASNKTFEDTNKFTVDINKINDPNTDRINPLFSMSLRRRITDLVEALAVCHNVTPTESGYHGSSPDEIAILEWANSVGIILISRTPTEIVLDFGGNIRRYEILRLFPFTSESRRMGLVVKNGEDVFLFVKGADSAMRNLVMSDWLDEETDNFARDGLRTLVIARRRIDPKTVSDVFSEAVIFEENAFDLLGLTGVEDLLQEEVRVSLECLANAGIKVWMLTGDKVETATSIAMSSKLFNRTTNYCVVKKKDSHTAKNESNRDLIDAINVEIPVDNEVSAFYRTECNKDLFLRNRIESGFINRDAGFYGNRIINNYANDFRNGMGSTLEVGATASNFYITENEVANHNIIASISTRSGLVIDGDSLAYFLEKHPDEFIKAVASFPVVGCRCTPRQKAMVAEQLGRVTGKRVCCVGDGGNDVAMITTAHIGVGIVGKEGSSAALAADYALVRFCDILPLLLYHGRWSYKATARLANLVIHRGTVIFVLQAIFCYLFQLCPVSIYDGYLLMGYSTVYTFAPILATVFSCDVTVAKALQFPELYRELSVNNYFDIHTFLVYFYLALWQGSLIMLLDLKLCDDEYALLVTISFTSLVINELFVVISMSKMDRYLLFSVLFSIMMYGLSVFFFSESVIVPMDFRFVAKVILVNVAGIVLIGIYNLYRKFVKPAYMKV